MAHWLVRIAVPAALGLMAILVPRPAAAVPSYTDQTGQPCQACHVGGFGPKLTTFGREFKLNGYTMRAKGAVPISAMAVASFTHTKTGQSPPPDHFSRNDNLAFDQGSIFLAGGIGKHLGGFVQVTYDGVERHWSWDNVDLRAVTTGRIFGQDAVFGVTLNNGPAIQDVWNTTPAWGYPYTDTAVSGTPGAAPLIDGGLAQSTLGLSAYTWIGQKFYLEAGAYTSPSAGTLDWLGADPADPGDIHGLAPYGRIAFQHDLAGGTAHIGMFALKAAIYPERDRSSGYRDHFTDIGVDASWMKTFGSGDTLSAQMRYIHEANNLEASCALGLIGSGGSPNCARGHLNQWRGDVNYSWRNKIGVTFAGFATSGSTNYDLYDPSGKPDSNGVMAQVDYTPWGLGNSPLGQRLNLRLGVQYTAYGKFDGASAGASGNNALRVFTWLAF